MKNIWICVPISIAFAVAVLISCNGNKKQTAMALPTMEIRASSAIQWDKKTDAELFFKDVDDSVSDRCSVKFRGGASSKYPKHSYSLKFSRHHAFCHLPASKSWILNASYIDKTFMRHKLCYDLFRQMGDYNMAAKCAYVRVKENGNPQGLYILMQRLNRSALGVDKSDPEAVVFKDPKVFFAKIPDLEGLGPNIHEQTWPEFEVSDKSYMIDSLRNFILNTPDNVFYKRVGQLFDMRNIVDWHLLLLFSNAGDGVLKNFYLYKIDSKTPYRIAIWDCDHSFGRDGDNEKNMLKHLLGDQRNILLNRLLQNESYKRALSRRWKQLRDSGVFSYDNIKNMMTENHKYIRCGIEENIELWPFDSEFYYDSADYVEECELLLEFVKLNLGVLDKRFGYQ